MSVVENAAVNRDALTTPILRVGSVSYLNAKPLIYGLESSSDISLHLEVPSRLLDGLRGRRYDIALLPVIDYQRLEDLSVVPAGGIGSDGHTLTVRIFSKTPIHEISTLACDTDSHTSVALARVILAETYRIQPDFVDLPTHASRGSADALLLIGDKVVCEEPADYPHQLDLGYAWKQLTGLPFVFACWMAPRGTDLRDLPQRLALAKSQGLEHVDEIIQAYALPRGWPADIARQYLTEYLKFNVGERHLEAIRLFHKLAARYGLIEQPARPLFVYENLK